MFFEFVANLSKRVLLFSSERVRSLCKVDMLLKQWQTATPGKVDLFCIVFTLEFLINTVDPCYTSLINDSCFSIVSNFMFPLDISS